LKNGQISYWASRDNVVTPDFPTLTSGLDVDVAIVGGGLTGLWAAWAIAVDDPKTTVAVFEAEDIGFGASGRNGGWLSAKPVGIRSVLARSPSGGAGVRAADATLESSIHQVVDILGRDTIGAAHGGWLQVARSPSELERIRRYLDYSRSWDVGADRLRLLSASETTARIAISRASGALFSPDCYRIDPIKALTSLAERASEAGVAIFTRSRVEGLHGDRLIVNGHAVRVGRHSVVATEGYSRWERGERRRLLPMNSAMLVTEALAEEDWQQIGWQQAECVGGAAHTFFYAQRTADGRIAIGGRGKPYRFGSALDVNGQVDDATAAALIAALRDLFPQVSIEPAHAWCGVLGVSRDWSPYVDVDADAKVIRVGGYAGQGLTAAYVGGRLVADLVAQRDTERTRLPWVRPRPRRWEPEPLRWIGANGLYKAYSLADRMEARSKSGQTAWPARIADRIAGR
jgi:glycine/D-amino acid oxidase-like deaminating enzyme